MSKDEYRRGTSETEAGRKARLAAELRANLLKRKDQARARAANPPNPEPPEPGKS